VNIFERWFPKRLALSISETASTPFGSFKGGIFSLILSRFFVAFHRELSWIVRD
jgi:hypothetical protein